MFVTSTSLMVPRSEVSVDVVDDVSMSSLAGRDAAQGSSQKESHLYDVEL
jgi:hypothetical protein